MNRSITLRRLLDASAENICSVQAVIEAAPGESVLTGGRPPEADAAAALFAALPPGKAHQDKFVLAVCSAGVAVGVVDLMPVRRGHG